MGDEVVPFEDPDALAVLPMDVEEEPASLVRIMTKPTLPPAVQLPPPGRTYSDEDNSGGSSGSSEKHSGSDGGSDASDDDDDDDEAGGRKDDGGDHHHHHHHDHHHDQQHHRGRRHKSKRVRYATYDLELGVNYDRSLKGILRYRKAQVKDFVKKRRRDVKESVTYGPPYTDDEMNMESWMEAFRGRRAPSSAYLHLLLGTRKCDPNWIIDDDRNTAVHVYARKGNHVRLRMLERAGADVHVRNRLGLTPINLAAGGGERRHYLTVIHLVNCGADFNLPDKGGTTPLISAILKGDKRMCRYLIEIGALVQLHKYESYSVPSWSGAHIAAKMEEYKRRNIEEWRRGAAMARGDATLLDEIQDAETTARILEGTRREEDIAQMMFMHETVQNQRWEKELRTRKLQEGRDRRRTQRATLVQKRNKKRNKKRIHAREEKAAGKEEQPKTDPYGDMPWGLRTYVETLHEAKNTEGDNGEWVRVADGDGSRYGKHRPPGKWEFVPAPRGVTVPGKKFPRR